MNELFELTALDLKALLNCEEEALQLAAVGHPLLVFGRLEGSLQAVEMGGGASAQIGEADLCGL